MLRFASAITLLLALCPAATALGAGGGAKTGAPLGADPAVIAQAPAESAGQGWESFHTIEDRFFAQQAVDAGLDAERARRMSAILLAFQKSRREILDLIGQGKITRAEMRKRARKIHDEREEKLKALLGEKIYAALDRDEASFRASQVLSERSSGVGYLTGERLVEDCKNNDVQSWAFCHGYIIAVVDSGLATGPGGRRGARRFCIPGSIQAGRANPIEILRRAVMHHLTNTPAARAKVGFEAVAEALAAEFPC